MRILVISNLYPPFSLGGYEERIATVVRGLRARGHAVRVLTSHFRCRRPEDTWDANGVCRGLIPVGFFGFPWARAPRLQFIERHNQRLLRELSHGFVPDVILAANMGGIGKSLLRVAGHLAPLVTDISDHWPIRGIPSDPYADWAKRHPALHQRFGIDFLDLVEPADPSLGTAYFTSRDLRDRTAAAGFPVAGSQIIHCGIRIEDYLAPVHTRKDRRLRCVYVGRLHPDKGVHTACAGVDRAGPLVELTVYGDGDEDHVAALHAAWGDHPRIRFAGRVDTAGIAKAYAAHDCLVFPSEWPEPFALTPLEASAAGLPVVGTTTGGSGEFLEDGVTALTWQAGNPHHLAARLRELQRSPELGTHLAKTAQALVCNRFGHDHMIDQIADCLTATVEASTKRYVRSA